MLPYWGIKVTVCKIRTKGVSEFETVADTTSIVQQCVLLETRIFDRWSTSVWRSMFSKICWLCENLVNRTDNMEDRWCFYIWTEQGNGVIFFNTCLLWCAWLDFRASDKEKIRNFQHNNCWNFVICIILRIFADRYAYSLIIRSELQCQLVWVRKTVDSKRVAYNLSCNLVFKRKTS